MQNENLILREKVNALFDNADLSTYFIEKESGVSRSTVSRIINGYRSIDNLRLETVEKLAQLYDRISN